MHATHCLIGCMMGGLLCVACAGTATAGSMDPAELGGSSHAAIGTDGPHDGTLSGGADSDAPAAVTGDVHNTAGDTGDAPPAKSSDSRGTPASAAPHRGRVHHLGWQSLLPGSIQ